MLNVSPYSHVAFAKLAIDDNFTICSSHELARAERELFHFIVFGHNSEPGALVAFELEDAAHQDYAHPR